MPIYSTTMGQSRKTFPPVFLHVYVIILLLTSFVFVQGKQSKDLWSRWFDEAPNIMGDNQTLGRIRQVSGFMCPVLDIVRVECRVVGRDDIFSQRKFYHGNYLSPPCDVTGVACSQIEQFLGFPRCKNYEIRFLCRITDSTSATTELQNPLSVHGGFIALAAGLSVVVPLICVLIVQLRRAKRDELNRASHSSNGGGDGNESCSAEGLAQLPPTYEELFGTTSSDCEARVTVMHSRYRSTDVLINESENIVVGVGLTNPTSSASSSDGGEHDSGGDSGGGGGGGVEGGRGGAGGDHGERRVNNPNFFAEEEEGGGGGPVSIATISGNDVTDVSVSNDSGSSTTTSSSGDNNGNYNRGNESNSRTELLDVVDLGGRSTANTRTTPPPSYSTSNSSVNRLLSALSSTTQSPPTYTPPSSTTSSSSVSHPIPSTTPSSIAQTNHIAPNTHSPTTSSNSGVRLPGMHISIQEFLTALREQSERELPPPSYEEALKILENAEKAKQETVK